MTYDPSAFGTAGAWKFGYLTDDATWRGSNFSGGFARITAMPARSGSAASNDLGAMSGRYFPAISGVGGNHLSFGYIYPQAGAALQKTVGSGFDVAASTGVAMAGVFGGSCGTPLTTTTNYQSLFGISFERMGLAVKPQTRELVVFALTGGGGTPATIVQTGLILPAAPTPVFFKYTSAGWVLHVKGVGRATGAMIPSTVATPTGGEGRRLTIGDGQGSATNIAGGWQGGIWCMDFWQGDGCTTGTADDTDESLILAALATEYGTVASTDLVVLIGDSRFSGTARGHIGEGMGGWLADAFPTARVVNLAAGGADHEDLAEQITMAYSDLTTVGLTPTRKVCVVSVGANEVLGAVSAEDFISELADNITTLRAMGFSVIFDDIFPVANEAVGATLTDAAVVAYETTRQALRTALQERVAAYGGTALDYCDHGPFRIDLTGASTDAAKAAAIRAVARGRMFEVPLPSGNDPAVLTGGDGIHDGHEGGRYRAMMLSKQITLGLSSSSSVGGRFPRF